MHASIRITAASLVGGAAFFCAGCSAEVEQEVVDASPECDCELKSWRVFARGRHLLIDIDCPEGYEQLSGRVEFTKASLRADYTGSPLGGVQFAWAPLARMSRGAVLTPIMYGGRPGDSAPGRASAVLGPSGAVERLEMAFTITPGQAEALQRDRMWVTPYKLFGPNSNSAARLVLGEIGVSMPAHVLESGGALGEFPGVLREVGDELRTEDWGMYGIGGTR